MATPSFVIIMQDSSRGRNVKKEASEAIEDLQTTWIKEWRDVEYEETAGGIMPDLTL